MDPVTLIESARQLGLTLAVSGGELSITGRNTPTVADLVKRMAPHKAAIMKALAPAQPKQPAELVGTVLDAEAFYRAQKAAAADGWTLRGKRFGPIINGYCDEWLITNAIPPAEWWERLKNER